jgi:hypothetical protein
MPCGESQSQNPAEPNLLLMEREALQSKEGYVEALQSKEGYVEAHLSSAGPGKQRRIQEGLGLAGAQRVQHKLSAKAAPGKH